MLMLPAAWRTATRYARLPARTLIRGLNETAEGDGTPNSLVDDEMKEIRAKLDESVANYGEMRGKYQRALAETENVRRRGQQQVEDAKVFAIQSFSKDLLEVADVLDLAIGAVDAATLDAEPKLKNLYDGVVMTKSVLHKAFNKHGLTVVSPTGEKFDPNLHDALFKIPQAQSKQQAGHVEQVLKIGYSLHNRPIRAAQVAVVQ